MGVHFQLMKTVKPWLRTLVSLSPHLGAVLTGVPAHYLPPLRFEGLRDVLLGMLGLTSVALHSLDPRWVFGGRVRVLVD